MVTRDALLAAVTERYQSSKRVEKGRILDEFAAMTGHHRKHAMLLLRAGAGDHLAGGSRPHRRVYDDAVREGPIVIDSTGLTFPGAGAWAKARHGEARRSWRKLHLSVNTADNKIIAPASTDDATSDAMMIAELVASSRSTIRAGIADGSDGAAPVYQASRAARSGRSPQRIIMPPGRTSIPDMGKPDRGSERERH